MNIFKRSLSAFLVLVMLVTAVPMGAIAVSAETTNGEEIYLDTPATAVIENAGETAVFYFTAPYSGYYTFGSSGNFDTYGAIYDAEGTCLANDDDGGESTNFSVFSYFEAGYSYELHAKFLYDGGFGDFDVSITFFPIASVECEPITIIENCNGNYVTEWSDEEEDYVEYYAYHHRNPQNFTVTMNNGDVVYVEDTHSFEYNGAWYNFEFPMTQSYDERWLPGKNTGKGSIGNVEFTYEVNVVESPITDVICSSPMYMVKDSGGYYTYDEYYNEETGEWEYSPEYYRYHPYPGTVIAVLEDGTEVDIAGNDYTFYWNGFGYNCGIVTDQSYENRWETGSHTATGSVVNFNFDFVVEIIEDLIVNVNVEPVVIYKNTNGYHCTETIWDEETQTEIPVSYYYYDLPWPSDYTITLYDGTEYHNDGFNFGGDWYDLRIEYPRQSYDNPLTVGVHAVKCSVGSYEFTFELEIRELPEILMDSPVVIDPAADGRYKYFKFVPEKTGNYVVTSLDSVDDPRCYIYDENGYQIAYDDDGANNNMNFSAACHMEAGKEYTICVDSRNTECAPYTVVVGSSPIVSVEVEDIVLIEHTNGYWSTYMTEDDTIAEYYHYSNLSPVKFTVTMKDGSVITAEHVNGFEHNGKWYNLSYWTNQGYEEQWGVGTNTVYADLGGFEFTYNVIVEESPVASIVADNRTIIQHTGGYLTNEDYYDEETGEWVTVEYFRYWIPYPTKYTITLKDGTVYNNEGFEWHGRWYSIEADDIDQSYDNQLGLGTYNISASICGYEFEYSFEIIDTPIASVEAETVFKLQYSGGYYKTDVYWDEDTDEYITTPEYFYYYTSGPQKYKITLKDGTVFENGSVYWNGEYYGLSMNNFLVNGESQSYDNQAGIGVYPVEASILGYKFTYNIEIIETPIESIEIPGIQIAENTQGYSTTDWYWNDDTQQEEQTPEYFYYYDYSIRPRDVIITLKDGTVHRGNSFNWNGQYYSFKIDYEQNYENRLLPGITEINYSIAGYKSSYTVEISSVARNDSFEYMITSAGIIITDCYLNCETIEIPSTIEGQPVIGVDGFNGAYHAVKHFIIPDSVKTIGNYVLSAMQNLESVTIGAGIRNLNYEMFAYNRMLKSISVSEDNENYTVINGVLYDKEVTSFIALPVATVDTLVVPKTCVDINALDYSIYQNVEISFEDGHAYYVTVDGVTYNKEMTRVEFCSKNYQGDYVMPDTVTEIEYQAFYQVDGLTSIVISEQVTEIVYGTFASCRNLKSVELPDGLVSIQKYAFKDTPVLSGIDLPETLQEIGEGAFESSGLTSVAIPDSCTYISYNAFAKSQIKTLDLGNGVVEIGSSTFANTPVESVVIPDSLTTLGYDAFYNCRNLKSVEIGSGLSSISSDTFFHTAIESIVIPENIQYIGSGAFANAALTSVEFKNPAINIGSYAFMNCPLDELVLGDKMTSISEGAFAGTNIKVIDIPDSVTSIVYGAFSGCEDLSDIRIPANVTDIGGHTFDNTAWYNSHSDGVMYLDYAVYSWKGTMPAGTSVSIKDGTTIIADYAFEDQRKMAAVALPESLEIIGDYAFYACASIESIHIPANVRYIGTGAFLGCKSLKEITVDPANENYYVEDGILFTVDGHEVFDSNYDYVNPSMWIGRYPEKSVYAVGEELDLTGVTVVMYYSNGYREFVTEDFESYGIEFVGFDSSVGGECRVDLICDGEQIDWFWVEVEDENADPDFIPGDITGDGDVNAKDANILKRIIAGAIDPEAGSATFYAADFNGDGEINAKDANILKRYIAGAL